MSVKPRKKRDTGTIALFPGPDPERGKDVQYFSRIVFRRCFLLSRGGELGYKSKKELDPAFAESSFQLKTRKNF